jgi:CHAT domain-containing protein
MKKNILIFLSVLNLSGINAQNYHKIDSLKILFRSAIIDTTQIRLSIELGECYRNSKPDSAIIWYLSKIDTVELNNYYSYTKLSDVDKIRLKYISNALRYVGIIYFDIGNLIYANIYYQSSLKIKEKIGDKNGTSLCLINLGVVNKEMGDYIKAIDYYQKSLKIKEEIGDKKGLSICLVNLGIVYYRQGNYPKALSYYFKSLKMCEELGDKNAISICLGNIGNVYYNQNDYITSAEYSEKSLKMKEAIGDKKGISICLMNLGNVYQNLGDYSKATEYYQKSLKIKEEVGDKIGTSSCLMNFGKIYSDQGDYSKALEYVKLSIKIQEGLGLYFSLSEDYPNLAFIYVKQNLSQTAAPIYLKAVTMKRKLIQDNFSILSEKEKGDFLERMGEIFNTLNEFALLTNTDSILKKCYDNVLLLKGLLLNSSSSMLLCVSSSKDTNLTNSYWRFKQLRNTMSALQSTPIDERKLDVDSIEKLATTEELKLVKLSKDFANLKKQYTYKWQDVQKNLKTNDIAIEFIKINYKLNRPLGAKTDSVGYAALILRSDYKYPQMVSLCSEAALQKMVGDLSWSDPTLLKMIYKQDSKKGLRLFDYIWKPLEPFLAGVENIYFAPVGVLNQISFAAIPTPDHKLLSDKYNLNLVSSTRVLIEKEENKKPRYEDAVVYGGMQYMSDSLYIKSLTQYYKNTMPQLSSDFNKRDTNKSDLKNWDFLPGTELELNKISKLLKKKKIKTTYYSGYNGLEEIFKENKTSPSIIHIATHGFSFPTPAKGTEYTLFENSFVHNLNPLFRSGLLFAGANRTWSGAKPIEGIDDGVLTAYEVSNLNLSNTKLVVLSACETGLGDLKGNEGVYGLQRAFKMAGVKYIVMSLWQVPDAQTVELMEYFYKELHSGKDIRLAFSKAQNKMKQKYEPYYWAGFVLVE